MTSQLPDNFFKESTESQSSDFVMRAAYLWSLLEMIQEDLNALSRRANHARLGPMSIETINKAFVEVKDLIADDVATKFLPVLESVCPPTHADALISIGTYKQALRRYRVEVLGEDPYRF